MAALAKKETRIPEQDVGVDFDGDRSGTRTGDGDRSTARRGA